MENATPFGHLYQSETLIEAVQLALRQPQAGNWELVADGIRGPKTNNALKVFKIQNGLGSDSVLNAATLKKLYSVAYPKADIYTESPCYYDGTGVKGEQEQQFKKTGIVLHHSVSDRDGRRVNRFFNDKEYGTAFALSGDGCVVQMYQDQDHWGWHLKMRNDNRQVSTGEETRTAQRTVAIEICSFGELDYKGGKFYNTYGSVVAAQEVCTLDEPFRGAKYFQKYTDAQIAALEIWIRYELRRHNLKLTPQIIDRNWFEYDVKPIVNGERPLFTHTNCRHTKSDLFPQPELVNMLQRLYGLPLGKAPGQ